MPVGTDVLVVGYQRNTGDIVIDPSLPITGVTSEIGYLQIAYQRTLSLFGRTATAQLSLPYVDGLTRGTIDNEFLQRNSTGVGDTRLRLAINLKGAPAMDPEQFLALRENPETIIGMSLIVQAPTGTYESEKRINVGSNRWSIKPAFGVIIPLYRTWLFEVEIGAWLFGDNDNFLGVTQEQDEIVSAAFHLVKRVRPGFWASLDATYYAGGETRIGGRVQDNFQRNSRAGITVVFPIRGRHAIRGNYSTGIATKSGGDFDILTLSYVCAW